MNTINEHQISCMAAHKGFISTGIFPNSNGSMFVASVSASKGRSKWLGRRRSKRCAVSSSTWPRGRGCLRLLVPETQWWSLWSSCAVPSELWIFEISFAMASEGLPWTLEVHQTIWLPGSISTRWKADGDRKRMLALLPKGLFCSVRQRFRELPNVSFDSQNKSFCS